MDDDWQRAVFKEGNHTKSDLVNALSQRIDSILHEMRPISLSVRNIWADMRPHEQTNALFDYLQANRGDTELLETLRGALERLGGFGWLIGPPLTGTATALEVPSANSIFVGRGHELRIARESVCRRPPSHVAILGIGGQGKTKLAIALLHDERVIKEFGNKRYWASMEHVQTLNDLVLVICRAVFSNAETHDETSLLRWLHCIGSFFLVLDNLETALDRIGEQGVRVYLRNLLQKVNGIHLVLTSRDGDPPFDDNVSWAYLPPFAGLEPDSATDLLLRTSGLPAPASAASNSITEMFTVLGYHPLSIVLTASRCRKRGRFDDALAELEKDSKAILLRSVKEGNRFDSLQACLELSYNSPRLSDTGRALFRGIAYLGQPVKPDDLPVLFRSLVNVAKATEKLRSIALSNKRVTIAPGSRLSICSLRSDATLFTRYPPMESLATCGSQQAEEILPALLTSKKAIFIIAKRVRQRIAEVVRRLSDAETPEGCMRMSRIFQADATLSSPQTNALAWIRYDFRRSLQFATKASDTVNQGRHWLPCYQLAIFEVEYLSPAVAISLADRTLSILSSSSAPIEIKAPRSGILHGYHFRDEHFAFAQRNTSSPSLSPSTSAPLLYDDPNWRIEPTSASPSLNCYYRMPPRCQRMMIDLLSCLTVDPLATCPISSGCRCALCAGSSAAFRTQERAQLHRFDSIHEELVCAAFAELPADKTVAVNEDKADGGGKQPAERLSNKEKLKRFFKSSDGRRRAKA